MNNVVPMITLGIFQMDETIKEVGKWTGLGGVALLLVLYIYREIIRKDIYSKMTKSQTYRVINLILVLTALVAVLGILAYAFHDFLSQTINKSAGQASNSNNQAQSNGNTQQVESQPISKRNKAANKDDEKPIMIVGTSCPDPPQSAVLNYWPITFQNPAPACHDFPALSGRALSNPHYPTSQQELDNGIDITTDQQGRLRVYLHDGAAQINTDPQQTTARNVHILTTLDNIVGTDHTVTVIMKGDNTNAVKSTLKIHTAPNQRIGIVSGSGQLRDWQNNVISRDFDWSSDYKIGDLPACFEHSLFMYFDIRVVT
jgi:hypothetical protein